jgi:hypothetical protein
MRSLAVAKDFNAVFSASEAAPSNVELTFAYPRI